MNSGAQLYHFLIDLHRHPVTLGARVVFWFAGALLLAEGVEMIYGSFVRPVTVQERAWWQWVYPPPLPRPFSYTVRALYVFMGIVMILIGLPFWFELFVK
jgi:hypothetical protein